MSKKRKSAGQQTANQSDSHSASQPAKRVPEQSGESAGKSNPHEAVRSQPPAADPNANQAGPALPPKSMIARYVSFGLLLGVILLVGFVFYEVMASFLVPLFLAALLVVVFRPLHRWIVEKTGGREQLGALLTTGMILLVVLIPLSALLLLAAMEGRDAVASFSATKIVDGVRTIRSNLHLNMPSAIRMSEIELELVDLQQASVLNEYEIEKHRSSLFIIEENAKDLASEMQLTWTDEVLTPEQAAEINDNWQLFVLSLRQARELHFKLPLLPTDDSAEKQKQLEQKREYLQQVDLAARYFTAFKTELLGGRVKTWLIDLVNPSSEELESYTATTVRYLQEKILLIGGNAAAFLGGTLLGFAIMIISLYFFLLDGPKMIESLKGLSPLDDEHEQQLVSEFGRVSRAVVVATLLSALVQGLLAGIGFYFAGLESIFLLTVLSGILAMVPFVGAAAVWVPCCLYLYFFDNNLGAAIGLAIYGTLVISMADNVIKPLVLHGHSNLHPLLALLSVLGGVATLGPIGILVGPMVVAFLQTLLKILQGEMTQFGLDEAQNQLAQNKTG